MLVIVLEDKKGFRKTQEVYRFTPVFEIAEIPPIAVRFNEDCKVTGDISQFKTIKFYPKGEPNTQTKGITFWLYREE